MGLRRPVVVLLVLVLAGCALVVALALTRPDAAGPGPAPGGGAGDYRAADLPGPGGDALDAAVAAMPRALGYDHRDLAGSLRAATATMTDDYAVRFRRIYDERVGDFAERRRAVTQAQVRAAGVVRVGGEDRAVCLLYVDQVLTSGRDLAAGETEVLGRNRVVVDMVRRGDRWLVDDLDVV